MAITLHSDSDTLTLNPRSNIVISKTRISSINRAPDSVLSRYHDKGIEVIQISFTDVQYTSADSNTLRKLATNDGTKKLFINSSTQYWAIEKSEVLDLEIQPGLVNYFPHKLTFFVPIPFEQSDTLNEKEFVENMVFNSHWLYNNPLQGWTDVNTSSGLAAEEGMIVMKVTKSV